MKNPFEREAWLMIGIPTGGGRSMNDAEIREYLLSHAPLDRFYLYAPDGHEDGLIRFTDPAGRTFVLAEDDDDLARHAIAVLKALGVRIFEDFSELLQHEHRRIP